MAQGNPVEFTQRLDNGRLQRCGNEVQLVDADGDELFPGGAISLEESLAFIGVTGSPGVTRTVTPTVTAGAYAANDVVGGVLEFELAARRNGLGGLVSGVTIIDDAGQDSEMELWLFNAEPDAIADNAAFAPTEDDLHDFAGSISTADGSWRSAGTPSTCYVDKYVRFNLTTGRSLWGFLVDRTGGTLIATDDITVKIQIDQD